MGGWTKSSTDRFSVTERYRTCFFAVIACVIDYSVRVVCIGLIFSTVTIVCFFINEKVQICHVGGIVHCCIDALIT